MPRERRERVNGPYKHGNKWRVVITRVDGSQDPFSFESESEAQRVADAARRQAEGRTVAHAIDAYEVAMRERNLAGPTIARSRAHLERLLVIGKNAARPLSWLTPARAAVLYTGSREGASVDTHRNGLSAGKSFGRFCAERGWMKADPFAAVKGVGKRNKGKPQLFIDESRSLQDVCVEEGSRESIAVLTNFLLGFSSSEVLHRQIRDLDDRGRVLHVTRGKNRYRVRSSEVPEVLRVLLAGLVRNRRATAFLFGEGDIDRPTRWWLHYHCKRLCAKARVPLVSPHGLRGTHSTIAVGVVATSQSVAAAVAAASASLGHAVGSPITQANYIAPGTVKKVEQQAFMRVLEGGRK